MEKKIKLALIISGAISLGSYQAGVIFELFSILKKLGKDSNFEIDVITGASAGSVNSVIFALAMMYDTELIDFTKKIWINGLDLSYLMEKTDNSNASFLSNRIILEKKQELIEKVKNCQQNPLPYSPDKVDVTITLSNLTGIPYNIKFNNKEEAYQLTTFADWYTLQLNKGDKDDAVIKEIERMIDMAIASGAFPFAFPAQQLRRKWTDYKKTAIKKPQEDELEFVYVDGGVFNNEPINRARELAEPKDKKDDKRIYMLIDPSPPQAEKKFEKLNMLDVGMRLIPAIFTEAHFRDWYHAVKVNQRLEWQKKMVRELKLNLETLSDQEVNNINQAWISMNKDIATFKAAKSGKDKDEYLKENKNRIMKILTDDNVISTDEKGGTLHEALANFVFVIENIGGLRGKQILDIRLLSPIKKSVLAGDFFISFGGFFSKKYREHDFNIGREVAREFISKPEVQGGLGIDLSSYSLDDISYDKNLNNVDITDAPEENKIRMRDNVVERVDSFIDDFLTKNGVSWKTRLALPFIMMVVPWKWAARKKVKSALVNYFNKKLDIK